MTEGGATELPMFPLGTVLVPGMALPLHIFEPRYRAMMDVCLAGDERFGVTLIERGSEVGGGDVRSTVGTVAHIVDAARASDGRWAILAVGERRVRVVDWLLDDPYPRARVADWPDVVDAPPVEPDDLDRVIAILRRTLAWKAELGRSAAPVDLELAGELSLAIWQLGPAAGLGPHDLQRVLATDGEGARLALLEQLLLEEQEVLRAEMGDG